MSTQEPFDILRGGPEDAADVLPLMIAFNEGEGIQWRPDPMRAAFARVLADPSVGVVLVARERNSRVVVGYGVATFGFDIEFAGRDAFITELFVGERYRGQGAGRELIDRFLTVLQEMGVGAVHLVVRPENEQARRLYAGYGFRDVPRTLMTRTFEPEAN